VSAQRFIGANSREAMNQVRLVLGEDAMILSSRMTDEGVEIMALAEELQAQDAANEPDDSPLSTSTQHAAAAYASQARTLATPRGTQVMPRASEPSADFSQLSERLLAEMQDMRQLIEHRATPDRGIRPHLLEWLLNAGFSSGLSEEILGNPPAQLQGPDATPARQHDWLTERLDSHLQQLADETELFYTTSVIALIGPTGVGKTTTTAKLAARYVMQHGAAQVALVTTDSFRIGAHEQLAIYAQLLGVQLVTLTPASELDQVLAQLAAKKLIIIDTVGMSQRDQRLLTQINQLGSSSRTVRLMLVLNAASHGDTLDEVLQTYRKAAQNAGCKLDDCIISKCDEAVRLGPVLDTVIRHGLRLNYLSVGQQVPEDLQLAATSNVVQQALERSQPSLFAARSGSAYGPRMDAVVRGVLSQTRSLLSLRANLKERISGFTQLLDAWPLLPLPPQLQDPQCAALLNAQQDIEPAQPDGLLLWGASRPMSGATWNMPLLTANASGQLNVRPWLTHRLPIGIQPRLDWCQPRWPAHRHIWSSCPSVEILTALRANDQSWLSAAKNSQRVMYQDEPQRLGTLVNHVEDFSLYELRYCGRNVRLSLGHLPVSLVGTVTHPLRAWLGTLHDSNSGQLLGQRCWLAGLHNPQADSVKQQASDLILQLTHDELATLTGRAWKLLADIQPQLHAELRLYLAAGLAASAVLLVNDKEDWAFRTRAQVLGLLTKKRAGNASDILEGLLHLLTISDALGTAQHSVCS
jgi:flagellar biosynthesis protein FlhF